MLTFKLQIGAFHSKYPDIRDLVKDKGKGDYLPRNKKCSVMNKNRKIKLNGKQEGRVG